MSPTLPRVAILDDYQKVAFTFADWSALKGRVAIDVFTDTISDEDALVARLEPYNVICAMRERTKFRASLLNRLPNLKFIATTGMVNRGIDVAYAKVREQQCRPYNPANSESVLRAKASPFRGQAEVATRLSNTFGLYYWPLRGISS